MFVKRDDNKRKSETPYRHDPYVITNKNGSMITAKNTNGKEVTRNSSFFKPVPDQTVKLEDSDGDDVESGIDDGVEERNEGSSEVQNFDEEKSRITVDAPERRYPLRQRKRPLKLKDYV